MQRRRKMKTRTRLTQQASSMLRQILKMYQL
jgi:hypothetical protein